jgi:hypothetical protein
MYSEIAMPSELITLAPAILGSAKLAYDVIQVFRDRASAAKRRTGIQKLYIALSATSDYIETTNDLTTNRDRDTEQRLDRMWRNAADAIAHIDLGLAERLYLKADYWRNPDRVRKSKNAKADLAEAKITIKDIRREMLNFL